MAWTYSDWTTYGEATASAVDAKLARLRLHMQEVADAISADVTAGSKSRASAHLEATMTRLAAAEARLMAKSGRYGGTGAAYPKVSR